MSSHQIKIKATSANVGSGYDVLGLALNITNSFEWEYSSNNKFEFEANFSELVRQTILKTDLETLTNIVTQPEHHLFTRSYQTLFHDAQKKVIPLKVYINLNIPVSRGLGSSATVILAGLLVAREVLNNEYSLLYSDELIFKIAYGIEGHPDNVAAALWGGAVINIPIIEENKMSMRALKIDFQAPLKLVGVIPHYQTSTGESREILPKKVDLKDVAFQSSRLASMIHLFQKKEWSQTDKYLLKICLADRLHQPYRLKLLPGAKESFQYWDELGLLASYISGSGSTLLAFLPDDQDSTEFDLTKAMREKGVKSTQVEFSIIN